MNQVPVQSDFFENDENLDQKFYEFHRQNPIVYVYFKKFAVEAMQAGLTKYGAKAIFERIRWQIRIEMKGADFKINNNYVSRYVRKLICECPEFIRFFETRVLKS